MTNPVKCAKRYVAGGLVFLVSAPFGVAAAPQQDQSTPTEQRTIPSQLPDSPAPSQNRPLQQATKLDARSAPPEINEIATTNPSGSSASTEAAQGSQQSTSSSDSNGQQSTSPKAVGTAAAPYEKPIGVAASRPAGAVIAPAKQRRVRSFLISIGIVVGAGVAIGTVAALSHASPSHP